MSTVANTLRYAWSSRRAWWFTATARTRDRFARTTLGSFWLGLSNLLSVAVLAAVYGTVFKVEDFRSYVVYLGIGLVVWNAIAGAVQSAPNLFRSNAGNLKNTNIHPIFYSLEEWSFQVQSFLQSCGLVLLVLTFFQPDLPLNLLTTGIIPLVNVLLFIYWIPLLICLLGAYFEDLFQLIPIALQLMFLLSPILYEKKALGELSWTADLNPLYVVMNSLRHALIHGGFETTHSILLLIGNLFGILTSIHILEKQRKNLPFLV